MNGWRPFVRFAWARKRGEHHFWVDTADGYRLHQWLAVYTVDADEGDKIFQIVVGPMIVCLAAKYA